MKEWEWEALHRGWVTQAAHHAALEAFSSQPQKNERKKEKISHDEEDEKQEEEGWVADTTQGVNTEGQKAENTEEKV